MVCAQGAAGRLGTWPAKGLEEALLDGAMDDFTSADLRYASLDGTDLTGLRWSLARTTWPPGLASRRSWLGQKGPGPAASSWSRAVAPGRYSGQRIQVGIMFAAGQPPDHRLRERVRLR
jgi:hypothetical protein